MNIEQMSQSLYGKSADPAAPENKDNAEFQAGWEKGQTPHAPCGMATIELERVRRVFPLIGEPEWDLFEEWKRGYWAGLFTRLEKEVTAKGAAGK